ncbi:hypothetical protein ACA910_012983 [Epithemia clementina (nom. ined.)]
MNEEELDDHTFAVMVHKLFQNRVQDFLLTTSIHQVKPQQNEQGGEELTDTPSIAMRSEVLDSPAISGVSRARRGFVLLLLHQTRPSAVIHLSPLARQNISWIARISNQVTLPGDTTNIANSHDNDKNNKHAQSRLLVVGQILWKALTELNAFDTTKDVLRVGVHPRSELEFVCRSLQHAATPSQSRTNNVANPDDHYDGPIELTPSRTKCTVRLTVIFKHQGPSSSTMTSSIADKSTFPRMYWGIDRRPDHNALIDLPLNHEANDEIPIVPCNSRTGEEVKDGRHFVAAPGGVDSTAPLSRAYYKLEQVYREHLASQRQIMQWDSGIGLDLGASPGGWTQVLVHLFRLASIVSVDAAALADRVRLLPQVTHVKSQMEDATPCSLTKNGPFSIVVCDACLLWMELFDILCGKVIHSIKCTLPSVWVLTMKLPFRSAGSIQRHIQLLGERLDETLAEMARALYPHNSKVIWKSQLIHLMANSDSERTLLIHYQDSSSPNSPEQQELLMDRK